MLPLGAAFVLFFWVAVPAILLMAVWAGVTAFRILYPDDVMPFDPVDRRRRASARGEARPVKLRDILEDERARQAKPRQRVAPGGPPQAPGRSALTEDLWLRRN
ncbi:hypothetical protein [Rubrivirga sp. IMCC43871]|uniref:hypothetical protein n=1 Tax=Rubrivirga sp. IMCC43871 TaxID=3391575 RepID=UPI0039902768